MSYEDLEEAKTQCRQQDLLIIMDEFNAKVEGGKEENVAVPHGLGIRNLRGEELVESCHMNNPYCRKHMVSANKKRKMSMEKSDDRSRNEIDKFLISKRFRNELLSAKTNPGVIVINTYSSGCYIQTES